MDSHFSSPETICLQCGDRGFENAFVYCVKCLDVAVHRYCLDVIPGTIDEYVRWLCDDCDVEVRNQPAAHEHDSVQCQTRDCTASEHNVGYREVEKTRNDVVAVNIEEPVYESAPCDAGLKLGLVEYSVPTSEFSPVKLRGMADELVTLSPASERKGCEPNSFEHLEEEKIKDNLMQHDKLLVDTLQEECIKKREGAIRLSTVDESQHTLDNNSSERPHEQCTNIDIIECAKLASDSKLSMEVGENEPAEPRDHRHSSQQPHELDLEPHTVDKSHGTLFNQVKENKLPDLENHPSDMIIEGSGINPSNYHNENRKVEVSEKKTSAYTSNFCKDSSKDSEISSRADCHLHAEPVITPVWRGSFNIWNRNDDILDGLMAHMSSQACHKVYEEACQFQSVLHLEILPRSDVWPKSFETSEPIENVALYFFPSEIRSERVFEHLVDDMVNKALAMRAIVQNAELLVFTSTELPMQYWRFQDRYYLWGVFRGKRHLASCSQSNGGESQYNPVMVADLRNEIIVASNPLTVLLAENRLKGPNYGDWKKYLNVVLSAAKLTHVLNEEPPGLPADDATQDAKDAYKLWCDQDSLAKCYILTSLEDGPQKQHKSLRTSKDIMTSLKKIIDQQNHSARENAMKGLICSRMIHGNPICDHVGKMIAYINELEKLGAEIDKEMKMDAILSSLPNAFIQFVLNVDKKNLVMTLFELRDMLQRAKDWINKDGPVIMGSEVGQTPKSSSSKKSRKKSKNRGNKMNPEVGQIPNSNSFKRKRNSKSKHNRSAIIGAVNDQNEDTCFHCRKKGHWRRNCWEYLATLRR